MNQFDKSSPTPVQKDSKTSGPSPSKRQSLRDAFLNFGKPNYAPLSPIEILPGIMSTDGVATVFQLDTRKPKTKRQVERMEQKKKRSASAAARGGQLREVGRAEWQDALQPGLQEGYFGSGSSSGSSRQDPNKPSVRKTLLRALLDDGSDNFSYEQMLNLKSSKRKDKAKAVTPVDSSKLGPPYPTPKPGLSPTDKLTVRHANPFTGLLSRNQTELNVSKSDDGYPPVRRKPLEARTTGGLLPSPPYPHSRYSYPAVSSPDLLSSTAAAFEDLIPMPSVHEPAPFSFPGATAEEIDAYERALKVAASSVANHLAVPPQRKKSTIQHLLENERSTSNARGDHFLALDGGLEQQVEKERRTQQERTRTSSLQDRHLQTTMLRNLSTIPPPPSTLQYPPYEGPAFPLANLLQSASNRDYRPHKHHRERRTSTSTSTMREKGDTHMHRWEGEENKISATPTPLHRRMEKMKFPARTAGGATGVVASTGVREKGEGTKGPKRAGSGPGPALFNMSMPFIDPRDLADYRRERAGLPPLSEKEGWVRQRVGYRPPLPFKLEIESPSSASVSESEPECKWGGERTYGETLAKLKEDKAAKIWSRKAFRDAEESKGKGKDYTFGAILTQFLRSLPPVLPLNLDLSLPPAVKEVIGLVVAFLEPVLTLHAPPQFWALPIALRVLLGMWYFVIVTWGILVVVRLVGIIGDVVGLIVVPVRGVVWVARVICGG